MEVRWALNNSVHRITKCKPFEVMFKYKAEGLINDPLAKEIEKLNNKMGIKTDSDPIKDLEKHRNKEQAKIAARLKTPEKFKSEDLVLVRWDSPSTGNSRKLEPKYKGPYVVSKVLRYDRYVVTDILGEQVSGKA